MKQISKKNFLEHYKAVTLAIHESKFIAIDCEFSGLRYRHPLYPRTMPYDTNQDIYERYSYVAQRFSLLQVGLSCFKLNPDNLKYEEETFSFLLHPKTEAPKNSQSSCLRFLSEHNFDFGRCYSDGLHYEQLCSDSALEEIIRSSFVKGSGGQGIQVDSENSDNYLEEVYRYYKGLDETKESFRKFQGQRVLYSKKILQLEEDWLEEAQLLLDDPNAKERTFKTLDSPICLELIDDRTGKFYLFCKENFLKVTKVMEAEDKPQKKDQGMKMVNQDLDIQFEGEGEESKEDQKDVDEGSSLKQPKRMTLKLSKKKKPKKSKKKKKKNKNPDLAEAELKMEQEQKELELKLRALYPEAKDLEMLEYLLDRIGFSLIFIEVLRARKPLIGQFHIFDFFYIYSHLVDDLPLSLQDYSKRLLTFFPVLYDTKVIGSEIKSTIEPKLKTGLEAMRSMFCKRGPQVLENEEERLIDSDIFETNLKHDAGYDAFISGFVFINQYLALELKHNLKDMKSFSLNAKTKMNSAANTQSATQGNAESAEYAEIANLGLGANLATFGEGDEQDSTKEETASSQIQENQGPSINERIALVSGFESIQNSELVNKTTMNEFILDLDDLRNGGNGNEERRQGIEDFVLQIWVSESYEKGSHRIKSSRDYLSFMNTFSEFVTERVSFKLEQIHSKAFYLTIKDNLQVAGDGKRVIVYRVEKLRDEINEEFAGKVEAFVMEDWKKISIERFMGDDLSVLEKEGLI